MHKFIHVGNVLVTVETECGLDLLFQIYLFVVGIFYDLDENNRQGSINTHRIKIVYCIKVYYMNISRDGLKRASVLM